LLFFFKKGEQLGMALRVEDTGSLIKVVNVTENGPADRASNLKSTTFPIRSNDEILEINGVSLFNLTHEDIMSIIEELPLYVVLAIKRNLNEINNTKSQETRVQTLTTKQLINTNELRHCSPSVLTNIKIPIGYNLKTIFLSSLESKCIMPSDLKNCSHQSEGGLDLFKIKRNTLQMDDEDHLQKGDILININGETLTQKNKFDLIAKLSSLSGTAEVCILRKTQAQMVSSCTGVNCYGVVNISSSSLLSSQSPSPSSPSSSCCLNEEEEEEEGEEEEEEEGKDLDDATSNNGTLTKTSSHSDQVIPYHNGIFAQNSIKLAMRKYEKPSSSIALKSSSEQEIGDITNNNNTKKRTKSNKNNYDNIDNKIETIKNANIPKEEEKEEEKLNQIEKTPVLSIKLENATYKVSSTDDDGECEEENEDKENEKKSENIDKKDDDNWIFYDTQKEEEEEKEEKKKRKIKKMK
jgi:hypothetical protein